MINKNINGSLKNTTNFYNTIKIKYTLLFMDLTRKNTALLYQNMYMF